MQIENMIDFDASEKSILRHIKEGIRKEARHYHIPLTQPELERYATDEYLRMRGLLDDTILRKIYGAEYG